MRLIIFMIIFCGSYFWPFNGFAFDGLKIVLIAIAPGSNFNGFDAIQMCFIIIIIIIIIIITLAAIKSCISRLALTNKEVKLIEAGSVILAWCSNTSVFSYKKNEG